MPRTLSYTDKALADLEAAETWLRQHGSGPAAWAKFDAIVSAIEGTFNTEIPELPEIDFKYAPQNGLADFSAAQPPCQSLYGGV